MNNYSAQFIFTSAKGRKKTWTLAQSPDLSKLQNRLRRIRQLVTILTGSSSELLTELSDFDNILEHCSPTWSRSIHIAELRVYTFFINCEDKTALITAKTQGHKMHTVGLVNAIDIDSYRVVITLMYIFIRIVEGSESSNIQWINDMAIGKNHPYQNNPDIIALQQKVNLYAQWKEFQYISPTGSHPSEINIAISPSSYEIIITKH